MNVVIVGKSTLNSALEQAFAQQGVKTRVIPRLHDLQKLKGEPGAYCAVTKDAQIPAAGVVVTEMPWINEIEIDGKTPFCIMQPDLSEKLEAAEPEQRIVFLLDYEHETPEYLTARALLEALALRKKQKKVVFLSRFVKTGAAGMEQVYRQARQAGVTFIKYEQVSCAYAEEQFGIQVFDGVFEMHYRTPFLVTAGTTSAETDQEMVRKLRLSKHNQGQVNGNKYFLNPVLTTRRGVYYCHPGLFERSDALQLQTVLPAILGDLNEIFHLPKPPSYACIDKEKCAFCYSCYRVCPHAALEPDLENSAMRCTESACVACGTCVAICPGQAITLENEAPQLSQTEIQPVHTGKCAVFCCENSAYPAMVEVTGALGEDAEHLELIKIPCGGRMGQDKLAAALASYDKVLLAVCMDDACRHMVGDQRACQHVDQIKQTAESIGLSGNRVACVKASHVMQHVLVEEIRAFLHMADE